MPRQRQGWVKRSKRDGRWRAGVTYIDSEGNRHWINRLVENKTEGKNLLKDLLRELDDHGGESLLSARMTFASLCDYYEQEFLVEPVYVHDRKVAGLRTHHDQKLKLRVLRDYFGAMRLRDITPSHLDKFKANRLRTPKRPHKVGGKKVGGGQRAIASVNRELALLRRMLNLAVEQGWLFKNPFKARRSLISLADEKRRERIVTREEEQRLLAACDNPRRHHLKSVVICALDTGMRRGEILKLKWSDIDFTTRTITIRAFNTKTMRERQVMLTERLKTALAALYELSSKEPDALCFGVDSVKKSFDGARRDAGLSGLRFHDLRHSAASRLVASGLALAEVGRILGHTMPATTYRYVNVNAETARRAAAALDQFNTRSDEEDGERETVN